jgi:hypothetical protein
MGEKGWPPCFPKNWSPENSGRLHAAAASLPVCLHSHTVVRYDPQASKFFIPTAGCCHPILSLLSGSPLLFPLAEIEEHLISTRSGRKRENKARFEWNWARIDATQD